MGFELFHISLCLKSSQKVNQNMPFNKFNHLFHNCIDSTHFISQTDLWYHQFLPIKLCICHYELPHFSPKLFEHYNVPKHQDILISVEKRQAEFLAGRIAARKILEQSSVSSINYNIGITQHRAPSWPKDKTGSISHTSNIAVAVIGDFHEICSLGIDIENNLDEKTSAQVAEQVHNTDEHKVLTEQGLSNFRATTLIFSAKEALYKALYKYVNEYFGFECARVINADLIEGTLQLQLEHSFLVKHRLNSTYQCEFILRDSNTFTLVKIHK